MELLLVEGEPRVASFHRQGLEEEDYRVRRVTGGRQARDLLREHTFDLPLLDGRLPDLDAVEDRIRGLRAGADAYLPGPFAFDELARIEALLRRTRAQFDLPSYFMARKGQVLSRIDIHPDVWDNPDRP